MTRKARETDLTSKAARARLNVRSEPYWRLVIPGLYVGLRVGKKGGAWIARQRDGDGYREARIGTPDDTLPADGKVVLSYSEAVNAAQAFAKDEPQAPAPRHFRDGQSLDDVVAEYLEHRQLVPGGRTGRTMSARVATETAALWKRNASTIGAVQVSGLTSEGLKKWHAATAKAAPTNRGKAMPFDHGDEVRVMARRASANRVMTIAKAALNLARERGHLPAGMLDFWRTVKPFRIAEGGVPRMLAASEVSRLLDAAAPDLRDLLTGALMTGARLGELTAMKVGAFAADSGRVRILQGKTGKTLIQPLTAEGLAFFHALTASRPQDAPMFQKADCTAWGDHHATRPVRAAAAAAGLEDVSFKTMRATYGKLLLLATKDLEIVAKALGHSDSRITRQHYADMLPDEVANGVALMPSLGLAAMRGAK